MANAQIINNEQQSAQDGDIVVALLEGEATIKRFYRETDRVRLQPENESMAPIYAEDAVILGKVTGVLRRL